MTRTSTDSYIDPSADVAGIRTFDDVTVGELVALLNSRNTEQLVVTDPVILQKRISGTFNLDHPRRFAAALEKMLGLTIIREGAQIRLEAGGEPVR